MAQEMVLISKEELSKKILQMMEGESFRQFYEGEFVEYIEQGEPNKATILKKIDNLLRIKTIKMAFGED